MGEEGLSISLKIIILQSLPLFFLYAICIFERKQYVSALGGK